MNIFLIGYRGTGKTTVAKHLAAKLDRDWVDADIQLEHQAGRSIATIFAEEGEPAFRDLECEIVAQLAQRCGTIVALGGGAVLRQQNRDAILAGTVVWLKALPQTIAARIAEDPFSADRRPSLTGKASEDEIRDVLQSRTEIYRQSSDIQVDTEGKTPSEIADEIVRNLPSSYLD